MNQAVNSVARRSLRTSNLVLMLLLVLLWVFLWDSVSWMTIGSGILVAFCVSRLFYLVPVDFGNRFSLKYLIIFLVRMIWDIICASVHVAWLALDWRSTPDNAIICLDLHTSSDLIMTWTVEAISLVPGTVVLEADREHHRLYLHVLNVTSTEQLAALRKDLRKTEERITMALGSHEEVASLLAEKQSRGE